MCEPVSIAAATIAVASAATSAIVQKNAMKKAENNQKTAIAEQNRRDAAAKAEAEKIGPAARKFDEVAAESEDDIKRRQAMLQNGIMGTMKTTPGLVSQAPQTEIKKATLGV